MTINLGIIGTGGIATAAHAPAIRSVENANFWSVLSRAKGRAEEFSKKFSASASQPAFDTLGDFLNDRDLHAVIITSPDGLHAEHAIACAEAGKHVLLEKPMVTDAKSGQKVIDACRRNSVRLAIAYHLRWHDGHRKLKHECDSGSLGTLRHIRAQWSWKAPDNSNWRASDAVARWWGLAGVGTHCLDLVRWFMLSSCGEVKNIQSSISNSVWKGPHDETALLSLQFENGSTAQLCSSVLFEGPTRFEVYGSEGFAICTNTMGRHGGGEIRTRSGVFQFEKKDPFVGEIQDFVNAIENARDPEVGGEEGLRNVELLLECN